MRFLLALILGTLACVAQDGRRRALLMTRAAAGTPDGSTNGVLFAFPMDRLPARELISGATATTSGSDIAIVRRNANTLGGSEYYPQIGCALNAGGASSGDRLSLTATSSLRGNTNGFSVQAWFHRAGAALPGNYPQFVAQNDIYSGGNSGFGMGYATGVGFRFYVGNGTYWTSVVSSVSSPLNTVWHHAMGVFDKTNSQLRIYIDGTNEDRLTYSAGMSTNNALFTLFSNAAATDNTWPGMLDEIVGWDHALTSNEVWNVYQRGLQGKQAPTWNNTNYVIAIMSTARTLYPESLPAVVSGLQAMSWASNHEAFIYASHQNAGSGNNPAVPMYIAASGDANFAVPFSDQVTNLQQRFIGGNTNLIVIAMTGENDIIILNTGGYTNWNHLPQPSFDITNVCYTLTNSFDLLWNAGMYGLISHTIPHFGSMVDAETNMFRVLNRAISNYVASGHSGFYTQKLDTIVRFDTAIYGDDFATDPGHTNWCSTNNILLNAVFNNAAYP
jgi:hypothetical protein